MTGDRRCGASESRRRVLADGWYSWTVPGFCALTDVVERWPRRLQLLMGRLGPLRALVLLVASTQYDVVAVTRSDRGWRSFLLLRALLGRRRKLVVLHFIDQPVRARGIGNRLDRAWRPVDRWATRRAMLAAQVLCGWEAGKYASAFGVARERFHFIPFAWRTRVTGAPRLGSSQELVIAAGRAFCDWPTLFAAARSTRWRLLVVCAEHDRALVEQLNANGRARVLSDIPHEEARELLRDAAVCVLSMYDAGISQGHVRLCDAVDAGTAVVASQTRSLEGYVENDHTAVLVAPGDPDAMRRAIDELLGDRTKRERLARAAYERAGAWTWDHYLAAIEAFAHGEETASSL